MRSIILTATLSFCLGVSSFAGHIIGGQQFDIRTSYIFDGQEDGEDFTVVSGYVLDGEEVGLSPAAGPEVDPVWTAASSSVFYADGHVKVTGDILPSTGNTISLGSASLPFKDLYLGSSTIYMENEVLDITPERIILSGADNSVQSSFAYTTQPYHVSAELIPNNYFYTDTGWSVITIGTNSPLSYADVVNRFTATNATIGQLTHTGAPSAVSGRQYKIVTRGFDPDNACYYTFKWGGITITNSGNIRTEDTITATDNSSLLITFTMTYNWPAYSNGIEYVSVKEYYTTNSSTYPKDDLIQNPTVAADWIFTGDCSFRSSAAGAGPIVEPYASTGTASLALTPLIEPEEQYLVTVDVADYNADSTSEFNIQFEVGGYSFDIPMGGISTSITALTSAKLRFLMSNRESGDNVIHIPRFTIQKYVEETYGVIKITNSPVWQVEDPDVEGRIALDMGGIPVSSDGSSLAYPIGALTVLDTITVTNNLYYFGNELISNNYFLTTNGWINSDPVGIKYIPNRHDFLHDISGGGTGTLHRADTPSAVVGRNYLLRYLQHGGIGTSGDRSIISWGGVSFPVHYDTHEGDNTFYSYIETNIVATTTNSLEIELIAGHHSEMSAAYISVREYILTNSIANNISTVGPTVGNICPSTTRNEGVTNWTLTGDSAFYSGYISIARGLAGAKYGTASPIVPINVVPGVDYFATIRIRNEGLDDNDARGGIWTAHVAGVTFQIPQSGIETNFTAANTNNLIIDMVATDSGAKGLFLTHCFIEPFVAADEYAERCATTNSAIQWTAAYDWGNHAEENYTQWVSPPTASNSVGVQGQISGDATYFYSCYDTDLWGRVSWTTSW